MMRPVYLLCTALTCWFPFQFLSAQTPAEPDLSPVRRQLAASQMAFDSGRYQQACDLAIAAHTLLRPPARPQDRGEAARLAGQAFTRLKKPDLALPYLEEALALLQPANPEPGDRFGSIWFSLGSCRNQLGEFDQAVKAYLKALDLRLAALGEASPVVASTYLALGEACNNSGDAGLALEYLKKNLAIRQILYGEDHLETAKAYHNLGLACYSNRSVDDAERYYRRGLDIRRKILGEGDFLEIAYSYNGLGRVALSRNDLALATTYFEQSLAIRLKLFPPDHSELVAAYNNLGICWKNKGDYAQALAFYNKALLIRQKNLPAGHPDLATPHFNLAACFQKKGDFELAVAHFDTALTLLSGALNPEHPFISETYFSIGETYESWAAQSGDLAHLEKARAAHRRAYELLLAQQKSSRNAFTKQQYAEQLALVCEANLRAGRRYFAQTGDPNGVAELWQYTESAKACQLYEAIQDANALHFTGIPDSLLARESALRFELTDYLKRRQYKMDAGLAETHPSVLALDAKIFDLNTAYFAFKEALERDYPDYFRLKYDLSFATLAETRQGLLPDQTLLEYLVGDSSIFLFVVKNDAAELFEFKKDFPLNEWVDQFRQGIFAYYTSDQQTDSLYEAGVNAYAAFGQKLYQKLLAPVEDRLTPSLIIIPDGELGYLPFEALLTGLPRDLSNFGTYPFVLRRRTLSYCYSATLLREMRQKNHHREPSGELLAVAPYYLGDTTTLAVYANAELVSRKALRPLKYSGEEAYIVQKLLGGELMLGEEATEARFVELAGNYRMLHLATHGKADDKVGDYSFLAFAEIKDSLENELLYVRDLYNMSLNADLVVLSACETGIGHLQRGEGILSLARAFAYAGAKGIVTTLWSVNDASTKELMAYFYKNLKKGLPKDLALAQAKRTFWERHPGQQSHPFFWAGFIPVGDMARIRD